MKLGLSIVRAGPKEVHMKTPWEKSEASSVLLPSSGNSEVVQEIYKEVKTVLTFKKPRNEGDQFYKNTRINETINYS